MRCTAIKVPLCSFSVSSQTLCHASSLVPGSSLWRALCWLPGEEFKLGGGEQTSPDHRSEASLSAAEALERAPSSLSAPLPSGVCTFDSSTTIRPPSFASSHRTGPDTECADSWLAGYGACRARQISRRGGRSRLRLLCTSYRVCSSRVLSAKRADIHRWFFPSADEKRGDLMLFPSEPSEVQPCCLKRRRPNGLVWPAACSECGSPARVAKCYSYRLAKPEPGGLDDGSVSTPLAARLQ
jgi:hypothetical protein